MTHWECLREADLLAAIRDGSWPERSDADLSTHVATCSTCGEVATVAAAIGNDARMAIRRARIPSSRIMWWRTQRRARVESTRVARQTLSMMQVATFAITASISVALYGGVAALKEDWLGGLTRIWRAIDAFMPLHMTRWSMPLIAVAATLLIAAPIAVYFALAED